LLKQAVGNRNSKAVGTANAKLASIVVPKANLNKVIKIWMPKRATKVQAFALLYEAVMADEVISVAKILSDNFEASSTDDRGNTFLHVAASENKVQVLDSFLPYIEYLAEMKNADSEISLHLAIRKGHSQAVRILIRHIPSLGICDANSCSPLHLTVQNRQDQITSRIVAAIISAGWTTLLNKVDNRGLMALHYAVLWYKRNKLNGIRLLGALNPGPVVSEAEKNGPRTVELGAAYYSRDAKDCAETSHGKINSFGLGNEVNSKKYKNKVYGRTGKKLDGNALAEAKCQRRNDVRRADRNPAAAC
jgi:hypothetical protein